MVEHVNITDPNLHEPKGVSSASEGQVYVADGSGSGDWIYFNWHGWGYYADASSGTQTFNTSYSKLLIDGGGAQTDENYLPVEIRGTDSLWNTSNNTVAPISVGDSYALRLNIPVSSKTGTPTLLSVQLDIGGLSSPSSVIAEQTQSLEKTAPFTTTLNLTFFCKSTFLSNGGQIFLKTDTGDIDVDLPTVLITRLSSGTL